MNKEQFTETMRSIKPDIKESTMQMWMTWAEECSDTDSSGGTVEAGSYRTAEMFLGDLAARFIKIKKLYGDEIADKVIALADVPYCPDVWELMTTAKCFVEGKTVEDIMTMHDEGLLDDWRDYYVTPQRFERVFNLIIKENTPFTPRVWVMSFRMERLVSDPEAAARAAVKEFISSGTVDAKEALDYAAGDFNWGDVMARMPDGYFVKYGLTPISRKETVDVCVDHDEVLE